MTGNISDLLRGAAARFPDRPALITDTAQWTWWQLDRAADVGAGALRGRGLHSGDRVLIHLPTGAELAVAMFAVARADLVAVPIDPHRNAPEIAGRLGAAVVLTHLATGLDPSLVVDRSAITNWFATDGPPVDPSGGGEDIALLARASRGGRAVMLSHRALVASVEAIVAAPGLQLTRDDRVLLVLPLFHLAGFVTAFLPLSTVGAAAVIADTPTVTGPNVAGTGAWTRFTSVVLKAVHTHRVTVIPGAPPLYRLLLRSAQFERSLATVRLMTSASSPLSPEDGAQVRTRTGSPVWEGYGISESASTVASTLMATVPRPGSVGLPLPGVEIRIDGLDDDPDDVDANDDADSLAPLEAEADPGLISIRGPQLFSGYWPDGADGPDADGWFRTMDVGYLDRRGELHLIDRIAETIAVAGFTVYPREVEGALLTHPFVRDAVVVGLPGAAGPELAAAVVAAPGTTPTPDDLNEHLAALLPAFKRPLRYQTVEILPRTELGRLDRDLVRSEWAAALGWELPGTGRSAVKLSVVAPEPVGSPESPAPPVPASEPPEVIEVSQLDQLGSRLPGVGSRSLRSAEDTDSDLFGEDIFGGDIGADAASPPATDPSPDGEPVAP